MSAAQQLRLDGGADLAQPEDRDRWCTPAPIIETARRAMGGIDLDPASNARAQEVVQATTWYGLDAGRDGLVLPWAGKVWCNPPYGRGLIEAFAQRIVSEVKRGEIERMVVLVNASMNARWMGLLLDSAENILIPPARIDFWHAETGASGGGGQYDQIALTWGLRSGVWAFRDELGWRVK